MSSVSGDGGHGLGAAVPLDIMQVGTPGSPAQPVHNANTVFIQVPLNWNVPVILSGGVEHTAPLLMTAPAGNTFFNVPGMAASHPHTGAWVLGPPPPAPPPVVQLVPVMSPVNAVPPPPQGTYAGGGQDNFKANPPEDYFIKPDSVYGNFRHWQHLKTLVRRHLPQTPDVQAFSCFLIPVLRSLARRRPNMNMEEGLWIGLKEWKSTSNYDWMIFFETADKFTEFERAEEMEDPRLQMMGDFPFQPPAAPLVPSPARPPAPEAVQKPVCIPVKTESKAKPAHPPAPSYQQSTKKTEAPIEIPPEAVQEYMDIMDWLEGLPNSNTGELEEREERDSTESEQERHDLYPDPGFLSYMDDLCSQETFVDQVEAIINPQFVSAILSHEPDMDMLALTEELEKEEGLTAFQLLEKRYPALKKRQGLQEPPHPGKPQAGRDDCAPQRGVGPQIVSSDHQGHSATNAEKLERKPILPGNQRSPSLGDPQSTAASFARGSHSQGLGSRRPVGLRGASPARGAHESTAMNSKGTDDLPSMSYLLSSQSQLVPWRLLQSLGPHSGLSQRKGLSPDPTSPKSKTPTVIRGLAPGIKLPSQGPDSKASEVSPALELACPSQPRKRKCESLRPEEKKEEEVLSSL